MNRDPQKHRRRSLPTWKRLGFEYLVLILAYVAAVLVTGNLIISFIAMLIAMIGLRITRPPRAD